MKSLTRQNEGYCDITLSAVTETAIVRRDKPGYSVVSSQCHE
jgi:hypothetical protein